MPNYEELVVESSSISDENIRSMNPDISSRKVVENKLITLLSTLLPKRNESLKLDDNFFELGGDSMMVIELVAKAKEQGIKIGIKQVNDYPTVASLTNNILDKGKQNSSEYFPTSVILEAIPLLPNQIAYAFTKSMTVAIYLLKPTFVLNKEKLENALQLLVKRHEALRIRFVGKDLEWQQIVSSYASYPILEHVQFDNALTDDQRNQLIRENYENLIRSIDVENNQVALRAALFEWGPDQLFFFAIDHYSFDDMSMKLFWNDLYSAYLGKLLPQIEMPYSALVDNLYRLAKTWDYKEDQKFWTNQFDKIKHIQKTATDLSKENEGIKAKIITLHSKDWVNKLLVEIPVTHGIQLHDVLLTAWIQSLCSWGAMPGVVLILGNHNRELLNDMVHTMGCFVTAYPVYFEAPPDGDLRNAIDFVKTRLNQVPHKGKRYMLSMMVEPQWKEIIFSAPQPSLGFNYLGEEEIKQEMWDGSGEDEIKSKLVSVSKGELLAGRHQTNGIPYLILHCQMNNTFKNITLTFDYDSSHYDELAIDQLLELYQEKLQEI